MQPVHTICYDKQTIGVIKKYFKTIQKWTTFGLNIDYGKG
ncbi:hypothetical protein SAMN05444277_101753 [Parafilimonas terrae]|uniref:Uncharacterized protein n=1 Tax=Parafilimonas terrae TaxID=1465490 RepID=A0A1I5SGH0_9BACT|nr:hypothetical protein SAMN05444277_101753 [Parafilimonas terrae]